MYPIEAAQASYAAQAPTLSHEQVSLRAYSKWLDRGCPSGDAETDWFDALHELEGEQIRQPRGQA
jgi:hypothetical protein